MIIAVEIFYLFQEEYFFILVIKVYSVVPIFMTIMNLQYKK